MDDLVDEPRDTPFRYTFRAIVDSSNPYEADDRMSLR